MTPDVRPANLDLLDGWKAIAEYLGKSVRTAQRWKQELNLPVHKAGGRESESVFAYRSELDAWRLAARERNDPGAVEPNTDTQQTSDADDVPAESSLSGKDEATTAAATGQRARVSPRSVVVGIVATMVLAVVVAVMAGWIRIGGTGSGLPAGPAKYRVRGNTLSVFDAYGRFLWEHPFPFKLDTKAYRLWRDAARLRDPDDPAPDSSPGVGQFPLVQFVDLNGDGQHEFLFISKLEGTHQSQVLCFSADGTALWEYASTNAVNFGDKYHGPLAVARGIFVTSNTDGSLRIWATFDHELWFPSVLVELDASGKQLAEYWSNGRLTVVTFASIAGRDLVLVGAPNNETGGGSLAVLDQAHFGGSAPAVNSEYRCVNCPPGSPEHFLVFPQTDIRRAVGGYSSVVSASHSADQLVTAATRHHGLSSLGVDLRAETNHVLDEQFKVSRAEFCSHYAAVHDLLFRKGRLDHPFDARREADQLWPVRRWNGTGWDLIRGPETR